MRRTRRRRGITLLETCVACSLGVLLLYVVAMTAMSLHRGAGLIAARAGLLREADLAVAQMVDSLRKQGVAPAPGEDGGVDIGADHYRSSGGVLLLNDQAVAWNVGSVELHDATVRLILSRPDVIENRRTGATLERTLEMTVEVAP